MNEWEDTDGKHEAWNCALTLKSVKWLHRRVGNLQTWNIDGIADVG